MSPLDDELRSLLRARADGLPPAPDPLAGIERRAGRIRRNRVLASVAGAAAVLAAVAVAVPSLTAASDRRADQVATGGSSPSLTPSASPSATSPVSPAALDPTHPWPYRGSQAAIAGQASLQGEWAARHPGATLTPLYGEIYESSQQPQVTFVSTGGANRWGVATSSDAGWTFLHDQALAPGTTVLMAALPADQVPRLQILAAPTTGQIEYARDGRTFLPLAGPQPGVAYTALEGDTTHDQVRVLDGNGDLDHPVFLGPAPDAPLTAQPSAASTAPASTPPSNYLAWQPRGSVDPRLQSQAVTAYARIQGVPYTSVGSAVLWGGTDAAGRSLLIMQAWVGGGQAQAFGFVSTGQAFLGPVLGNNPALLAYLAPAAPGQASDTLVLLPRPGAGPFSYASSPGAPYRPVGNARSSVQNVALIDRAPHTTNDRVRVLDGDGMHVLYDGPVQPLLCAASGCS